MVPLCGKGFVAVFLLQYPVSIIDFRKVKK